VPPDRDINIVETIVVEEPRFGEQLEFEEKHFGSRPEPVAEAPSERPRITNRCGCESAQPKRA
jgi:hypothetical protein